MSGNAVASELLTCIQQGSFPSSEETISSNISRKSLELTLDLVKKAKADLESKIRISSRENAPSTDEWITKAREISLDIEKAKAVARDIVRQHDEGSERISRVSDAQSKIGLLKTEIDFNNNVLKRLDRLKDHRASLNSAEQALRDHHYLQCAVEVERIRNQLGQDENLGDVRITEVLRRHLGNVHESVFEKLQRMLLAFVKVEHRDSHLSGLVLRCYSSTSYNIDEVVTALKRLQGFDRSMDRMSKHIETRFLEATLLHSPSGSSVVEFSSSPDAIHTTASSRSTDSTQAFDSLTVFATFVMNKVPLSIRKPFAERLIPHAVNTLINEWLTPSIPLELSRLERFEIIQKRTQELGDGLPDFLQDSKNQLAGFLERVPKMWLIKRRMAALDNIRSTLRAERGSNKTVERVERRKIENEDDKVLANGVADDWDAQWGDDRDEDPASGQVPKEPSMSNDPEEEDSGWNFDDDDADDRNAVSMEGKGDQNDSRLQTHVQEDEDEAWGWGDDNINEHKSEKIGSAADHTDERAQVPNGTKNKAAEGTTEGREVILKEIYTITDIPEAILKIIYQQIEDARELGKTTYDLLDQNSSITSLLNLPTLVLAMFRATAPTVYETGIPGGNMHLYNDCMFLAERLGDLTIQSDLGTLESDIASLERFARMAYAREMETQRTILDDLLDGAQGFVGCAEFPVSAECETAVGSTVDRLRATYREWKQILSHSALLQSIGSLLARVIDKTTKDILDMEDISDADSQRLAAFCNQIAELEDLFIPEAPPIMEQSQNVIALTPVYVPNWIRFRYLAEILESKLVDIKYMWTESELSHDFTAEEVVDLIEALFSDTRHRKEAIAEIRRSSARH